MNEFVSELTIKINESLNQRKFPTIIKTRYMDSVLCGIIFYMNRSLEFDSNSNDAQSSQNNVKKMWKKTS